MMNTNEQQFYNDEENASNEDVAANEIPLEHRLDRFLQGELVLSSLYDVSEDEMWGIATIGKSLIDNGRLDDAQKIFEGLTALDPYESFYHSALGCVYQRQNNLEQAEREYERAAFLNNTDLLSRANRVEVLVQLQRFDDAVKQTAELTTLDPRANNEATQRAILLVSAINQNL